MVRRIGLALLSALALIVLLIAAAFGLAQTGYGKRLIASQLGALLTTPETAVEITGLEGLVPVDMRIGRITAADDEGVWLEAADLELAWSPGALLAGRIRVERLGASRIAIERLPSSEPSTEPIRMPEPPGWLPPTSLQQLSVAKLDLGPDVLGEPASFALTGSLDMPDDGGSATLALDLERLDQTTASVTLDATLQLEPPALDLSLRGHEEGGLLAALTGEAEAKSLVLELAGNGPLDAWKGDLHADAEGLARADATLGIALDDQLALTLDGEVVPAAGVLPADVAAALGDRLGLSLAVTQTGPQQLEIEHLRATAANAEITAEGTMDLEAERFQASARAALSDLTAFSELAGTPLAGAVQLDLAAKGGFLQPGGTLQLQGSGLAAAGITADRLATSFDFAAAEPLADGLRGLALTGSGQTEGLAAPDLAPLPLDDLSWQVDLLARQEDAIELNLLRLSMADIVLAVQGEVDPTTLAASGQVDLTLESLARLAAPYGQAVDGGVALHADLVVEQGDQVEAKLKGTIDRLSGLPPGAAELLGTAVELAATVGLQPDSVRVGDLAIEGAAVALTGDVGLSLPDQGLDGTLTLNLPRLAVLEPVAEQTLAGALEIAAAIAGSVPAPDLQLTARSSDLVLADRPVEKLELLATAQGPSSEPTGKVELDVTASGIAATLSTLYQLRDQTLALTELALTAPRSRIDGALSIDLERTLIDGTIKGRVEDLAGLAPLLPMPLRGAVDLDALLRPEAAGQAAQLSLAVRDLSGDFGGLRSLEANAQVSDALGKPGIEASASAREFRQDDLHVAELALNVAGTLEQLTLRTTARGEMVEPFDLEARAQLALGQAIRVRLEQLSGRVAGKPVRLAGTTEVSVGDEMRLSGLDLEVVGARINADAAMAGQQVTLDAALQNLELAELADFGAPAIEGQANAQLQMRGAVGDPSATLDLTVNGLRAADPAFDDLPPAQLAAKAELASRRLRVDARGEGVTDKPMVLSAELPVVLQLEPFAFELPDGPVAGRLDAEVQLARLADVAGLDDDRLEGLLAIALNLAGSFQDPQLNGTIDITDGIYENGLTGTVLRAMTLRATARQQRITIDELSANDGGTGSVSGEGFVDVDPAASFPLDVRVALRSARLVQITEADATISGDLALSGNVTAAKLGGTLTVDRAEVYLPDQVGPSVPTIEVEEVGGTANGGPGGSAGSGGGGFDLGLDVVVELPGRAFVRGRGLESEWEGRIAATGTAAKPILTGSLSIKRGYFDLLDQRFNLRRGVITFNGESPPNPTIDLEATAQAGDITGIIRVEGLATKPTLTLDSEPPMPQDEVLSRLLFNRAASEITPVQAVQLAAAVNRLRGGGPGVLDRVRGALGVDTLDVGGGDQDSGTTVKAGKYLSDKIYVEGETGTEDQSSRARVEVEILPNISLQADTGADATSGVGIKWKFDY